MLLSPSIFRDISRHSGPAFRRLEERTDTPSRSAGDHPTIYAPRHPRRQNISHREAKPKARKLLECCCGPSETASNEQ